MNLFAGLVVFNKPSEIALGFGGGNSQGTKGG
jgi:hypothetical protein